MNFEDINFPVYRKYKNSKSYFKIIHSKLFEEKQIIGSKIVIKQVSAVQFPEMNFIRDLVFNFSEMAVKISVVEYEAVK